MNIEKYKQRLQMEEKRLVKEMARNVSAARQPSSAAAGDAADTSILGEQKEETVQQVDLETAALHQVREALLRIEEGTYGKCIVDDAPIDERRLDALPWTSYCIKHQQLEERSHPSRTPTL